MVPKLDAESDEVQDDSEAPRASVRPRSNPQFQHLDIEFEEISASNSVFFPIFLLNAIALAECGLYSNFHLHEVQSYGF
ncbi:hypothetical protein [Nostoc sp. ChiSLP03a]|uniref:hypothetical protein n=1 Tax=Nostoc sp. ChiSLP03a TaxID=3075380 RepID=UPI002AD6F4CA|nr:hypothetical protein [Nostoc sp. ChiSLP03a]